MSGIVDVHRMQRANRANRPKAGPEGIGLHSREKLGGERDVENRSAEVSRRNGADTKEA